MSQVQCHIIGLSPTGSKLVNIRGVVILPYATHRAANGAHYALQKYTLPDGRVFVELIFLHKKSEDHKVVHYYYGLKLEGGSYKRKAWVSGPEWLVEGSF